MKREGTKSFLDQMRTVKPSGKIGFVTFMHDVYLYICYVYIQCIFVCMFTFIYDVYLYVCMLWRCYHALLDVTFCPAASFYFCIFIKSKSQMQKVELGDQLYHIMMMIWWQWRFSVRFFQPAKPSLPEVTSSRFWVHSYGCWRVRPWEVNAGIFHFSHILSFLWWDFFMKKKVFFSGLIFGLNSSNEIQMFWHKMCVRWTWCSWLTVLQHLHSLVSSNLHSNEGELYVPDWHLQQHHWWMFGEQPDPWGLSLLLPFSSFSLYFVIIITFFICLSLSSLPF